EDLPADPAARDDLLLRIMGSPDARQIDGIGGAHPLTSKVAVISASVRPDADVDYLFLQVGGDQATVPDKPNCGNPLAGVGPVVVVPAAEFGRSGYETVAELEADDDLRRAVRALQLAAGQAMGLGDVSAASVPKISLIAAPADGGTICTRTFIPVRVHDSIGVLGAVSVATALLIDGAAGASLAVIKPGQARFDIEHPTGHLEVEAELDQASQPPRVV